MQKLTGLLNSGTPASPSKENSGTSDSHSATSKETRMEALFNDAGLTDREKDIAKLIADGCTNSQIASLLYISEGTVKNYVSIIYDKFDIKDRAKLVAFLKA